MASIRVGNAPCSWGVMGGYDAAFYPPYAQVLDEIAAAGYTGTELGDWGYLPTDATQLRDELAARDLSMIGALVPSRWRIAAHMSPDSRTLCAGHGFSPRLRPMARRPRL